MVKKIALEEHFLCPGFEDYWKSTVADVDPEILKQVVARLSDFGEQRLAVDGRRRHRRARCSRSPDRACRPSATPRPRVARRARPMIFWRARSQKRPDRYSGFAHLPMQDAGRRRGRARTLPCAS